MGLEPDNKLTVLNALIVEVHQNAKNKGWWNKLDALHSVIRQALNADNAKEVSSLMDHVEELYKFARTMLIVSELSEGIEGLRAGNPPDDKVPQYDSFTVELADAVIRAFDIAGRFNLKLGEAILAKMEYNTGRAFLHGGKTL